MRVSPLGGAEADRLLAGIGAAERYRQAWGSDGTRLYAADRSVWEALYRLPGGWLLRSLRLIPGFDWVSFRVYRWVAEHRSPACRLKNGAE